jgi:hypothetical protein
MMGCRHRGQVVVVCGIFYPIPVLNIADIIPFPSFIKKRIRKRLFRMMGLEGDDIMPRVKSERRERRKPGRFRGRSAGECDRTPGKHNNRILPPPGRS